VANESRYPDLLLAFDLTAGGFGHTTASRTVSGGAMGASGCAILGASRICRAWALPPAPGRLLADISTTSSKRGMSTSDLGVAAPSGIGPARTSG